MPVGKNALKRVSNNGYSKVNTSAPDMEHSEVAEPVVKATEKSATKNTPKSDPKAKVEKKTAKKAQKNTRPDGFVRVELGDDMPIYLL